MTAKPLPRLSLPLPQDREEMEGKKAQSSRENTIYETGFYKHLHTSLHDYLVRKLTFPYFYFYTTHSSEETTAIKIGKTSLTLL